MPRLENWAPSQLIQKESTGAYMVTGLVGAVYDDEKKRFEDGTVITTSPVRRINIDQTEACTMNTVYQLGTPDPEWVAFCSENDIDLGGYSLEQFLGGNGPTLH